MGVMNGGFFFFYPRERVFFFFSSVIIPLNTIDLERAVMIGLKNHRLSGRTKKKEKKKRKKNDRVSHDDFVRNERVKRIVKYGIEISFRKISSLSIPNKSGKYLVG